MNSKKILITGASGMLGTDLCAEFGKSFETVGTDIRPPVPGISSVRHLAADLADRSAVSALFGEVMPAIVIHAAAMTNVDACEKDRDAAFRANVTATRHVTDAANECGARLLFFSTDYVFDGTKGRAYEEDDPRCPVNYYGRTKAEAEKYILETARQFVIFRISWLFGLNGPSFPKTILEKAGLVETFEVVCDQLGSPTSTRDVAAGLRELFIKDPESDRMWNREIFHLTNGGFCSWADYAEYVLGLSSGKRPPVKKIPTPPGHRPAERPKYSVLSPEKTKRRLGIELRSWQNAVAEFVKLFESKKG
jgi:dTDP-4-dehydrorhamnose reductase